MHPEKHNQILPAVAAAIFNEKGEILLQKRGDVHQWCIISGHVEFGETIEAAMLREIQEELNVDAELVRLIGIYSSPESQTYHYSDRNVHYITSYFEVRLTTAPDPDFSNSETRELRYFHPDSIPEDLALINENWLTDALNNTGRAYIR